MINFYQSIFRKDALFLATLFVFAMSSVSATTTHVISNQTMGMTPAQQEEDVPGPLPAGWTNANIGSANGSATYDPDVSGGQFVLTSTGYSPNPDIQHSAWRNLCGNVSITARVAGIGNPGWAGIEIRESAAPGSRKVALKTQLANITYRVTRTLANGPVQFQQFPTPLNPGWIRITRSGNTFQFFVSTNGSTWQLVGFANIALSSCVQVGLFAESINALNTTTATFDNVSTTGSIPPPLAAPEQTLVETAAPDFQVYPNPTSGEVNLDLSAYEGQDVRIELYNAQGQLLQARKLTAAIGNVEQLDLSAYQTGMYWIKLSGTALRLTAKQVILK